MRRWPGVNRTSQSPMGSRSVTASTTRAAVRSTPRQPGVVAGGVDDADPEQRLARRRAGHALRAAQDDDEQYDEQQREHEEGAPVDAVRVVLPLDAGLPAGGGDGAVALHVERAGSDERNEGDDQHHDRGVDEEGETATRDNFGRVPGHHLRSG